VVERASCFVPGINGEVDDLYAFMPKVQKSRGENPVSHPLAPVARSHGQHVDPSFGSFLTASSFVGYLDPAVRDDASLIVRDG